MTDKNANAQIQFLKVLCELYDGTGYVREDAIRAAWPECPSHQRILDFGADVFFERDLAPVPAYKPTGKSYATLREWENIDQISQGLQKLRDDFDEHRADETAYHTSQELNAKKAEKRSFWRNIVSSVIAAIIGGLVVYYWPDILDLVLSVLH